MTLRGLIIPCENLESDLAVLGVLDVPEQPRKLADKHASIDLVVCERKEEREAGEYTTEDLEMEGVVKKSSPSTISTERIVSGSTSSDEDLLVVGGNKAP